MFYTNTKKDTNISINKLVGITILHSFKGITVYLSLNS